MPEYRFSYQRGRVKASHGVTAESDMHAFKKMQQFIKMFTVKYIKGSMMVCPKNASRFVPIKSAAERSSNLQAAE